MEPLIKAMATQGATASTLFSFIRQYKPENRKQGEKEQENIKSSTELHFSKDKNELVTCIIAKFENKDWDNLISSINKFQNNFVTRLRMDYPKLTKTDIRIILLIRFEMSHSDIAQVLNIQMESFRKRRYRLKGKMGINDKSFTEFIKYLYVD